MIHLAEQNVRCVVCNDAVPKWLMPAELCVCAMHSKQLLTWCRKEAWIVDMGYSHKDFAAFAPKGMKALKECWDHTCSRCACCGKDGKDSVVLHYGADEQSAPNEERAPCCYCREQIDSHHREHAPRK